MNTKCEKTKTLEQPKSEILLDSRLAVPIGVGLAFLLVFIVIVVACCSRLCAKKPDETKEPESPEKKDYSSYKHFTIPLTEGGNTENLAAC